MSTANTSGTTTGSSSTGTESGGGAKAAAQKKKNSNKKHLTRIKLKDENQRSMAHNRKEVFYSNM
jgi:hypothetical protein